MSKKAKSPGWRWQAPDDVYMDTDGNGGAFHGGRVEEYAGAAWGRRHDVATPFPAEVLRHLSNSLYGKFAQGPQVVVGADGQLLPRPPKS